VIRIELIHERGNELDGHLVYDESQYSFRFDIYSPVDALERSGDAGQASLMVGTLQVEVGVETGELLYAWGLHPRSRWTEGRLKSPFASPGVIRIIKASELQRGVGMSVAGVGEWCTVYDSTTGWLCISPDDPPPDQVQVRIATDTVLGIQDMHLNSIWLRPEFD
jgi:hypothetical protein